MKPIASLAMIGLLSGCAAFADRPAPAVVAHSVAIAAAPLTSTSEKQLLVALPGSGAMLDSSRVLVRPRSGEFAYLSGVAWPDRAPRLLQDQLVDALQRSGGWRAVERHGAGIRGDQVISLSLHRMEIDYSGADPRAVVEFVATSIESQGGRAQAQRRFQAEQVVSTDRMLAAQGLQSLLAEQINVLVQWLHGLSSAAGTAPPSETSG